MQNPPESCCKQHLVLVAIYTHSEHNVNYSVGFVTAYSAPCITPSKQHPFVQMPISQCLPKLVNSLHMDADGTVL